MEKSLFHLCRRWLHSKGAPARMSLVLKNRDDQLYYLSLSSPALGLFWLALQEEKLPFDHYCYCPIFPCGGDQNAHPWLGFWTFPYGKLKTSHVVLSSSGCTTGATLKVSGAKSWSSTQLEILHRDTNHRAGRGFHKGGDISKRGKGRCKSVEQSLSCGRKARGNSGELQEQNNPCFPLAVEGPHPHKHPWPSSGRLDDPICSENVIL